MAAEEACGRVLACRHHGDVISVYLVELVKQQQALIETLQEKVAKVEARFAGDASPATA